MNVRVYVTLKRAVLDPQGKAVARSLSSMSFAEVRDVRLGKLIELTLDESDPERAKARVSEMCRRLLANTVIEDFRVEVP